MSSLIASSNWDGSGVIDFYHNVSRNVVSLFSILSFFLCLMIMVITISFRVFELLSIFISIVVDLM